MAASHRANWPKTTSLLALTVYWIVLFVATHIPLLQPVLPLRHSDKMLHVSAFAVLAFLLALAWSLRRPFAWRQLPAALAILVVYAAFDEATQPLVNRHGDWRDWIADAAGALAGLAIFCGLRAIWRRAA